MNLLKISLIVLLPVTLHAQHITIRDKSGNVVNNDTLSPVAEFVQKPPYTEIVCYLYAQNNSTATMHMGAKKTEFILSSDAEHSICFAFHCYQSGIYVSPNADTITPGGIDSTFSGHYRYLKLTHTPSIDLVAYTIYDVDNPSDSAIVYVKYNTMTPTGMQPINEPVTPLVNIYPNPASNSTAIIYSGKGTLQITDVQGKAVYNSTFDQKLVINISTWAAGTYFVKLLDDKGDLAVTKMLKD